MSSHNPFGVLGCLPGRNVRAIGEHVGSLLSATAICIRLRDLPLPFLAQASAVASSFGCGLTFTVLFFCCMPKKLSMTATPIAAEVAIDDEARILAEYDPIEESQMQTEEYEPEAPLAPASAAVLPPGQSSLKAFAIKSSAPAPPPAPPTGSEAPPPPPAKASDVKAPAPPAKQKAAEKSKAGAQAKTAQPKKAAPAGKEPPAKKKKVAATAAGIAALFDSTAAASSNPSTVDLPATGTGSGPGLSADSTPAAANAKASTQAPASDSGSQAADTADGIAPKDDDSSAAASDGRDQMKARRFTELQRLDSLPQEFKEEYRALELQNGGKISRTDFTKLINASFTKSGGKRGILSLVTTCPKIAQEAFRERVTADKKTAKGEIFEVMRAQCGGQEGFESALRSGRCYEGPDGLYYTKSREISVTDLNTRRDTVTQYGTIADDVFDQELQAIEDEIDKFGSEFPAPASTAHSPKLAGSSSVWPIPVSGQIRSPLPVRTPVAGGHPLHAGTCIAFVRGCVHGYVPLFVCVCVHVCVLVCLCV